MKRDDTTSTFRREKPEKPLGAVLRPSRPSAPTTFRLSDGTCTVGAGRDVDLIIEDPTVSRRHVELRLTPEGVAVKDLASHNGTFYLGQRLESAVLALGSVIQLGQVDLRIDPDLAGLRETRPDAPDRYGALVGASAPARAVFSLLLRLENSLVTVLVEGESGTGKELVARAIHDHSPVANGPFVVVNCGALDRQLVRSELFGHKRGAFTGALESREGAFADASGGTLFLDEVGELPLETQPVLLRALEVGAITRVGESNERPVKVRIVAATNRDLGADVRSGRFREDLFHRLRVIQVKLPSLAERPDDVELLALHFAVQSGLASLPREVLAELRGRRWPGNARELRNVVQAYAVLGALPEPGAQTTADLDIALRKSIDPSRGYSEQKERLLERFLRIYLELVLEKTGGNQSLAAKVSGLERSYLNKLVNRLRSNRWEAPDTDD